MRFVFRFSLFDHRSLSFCYCHLRTWMSECLSEWVSELESEWVSVLRQSNSSCHMQTFISSKSRFFSFFAFRFSRFAFRFLFFAFRSQVCVMLLLLSAYMNEWMSEWVSELEHEWVSVLRQSNSSCHMQTFIWSKSRFFLFFAFRFSLFAFRFSLFAFHFSLFDNRSASRFYCLVSEHMSEWVCAWASEWVKKWVSVLRPSNSSCHMQTFISSKSRFFLFFAFRFSFFAFRFSLFAFRS